MYRLLSLLAASMLIGVGPVLAQEPGRPGPQCGRDAEQLCAGRQGPAVLECLKGNTAKLSQACKSAIDAMPPPPPALRGHSQGPGSGPGPRDPDGGRPVEAIARELGVTPEQFREAFRKVTPAPHGQQPSEAQREQNRKLLSEALNVSPEKLDAVMDKYRPEGPPPDRPPPGRPPVPR